MEESKAKSRPWEMTKDDDSEVCLFVCFSFVLFCFLILCFPRLLNFSVGKLSEISFSGIQTSLDGSAAQSLLSE